jgi:NAD(P)-dependent dehydrogenase (short-subunit alcohol dehydrogenase family)
MQIAGKTAIITGGASGMGRATAERLHALGANVSLFDLNGEACLATANALGARALSTCGDVTDEAAVKAALDATQRQFGDIHICCNFAGIAIMKRVLGAEGAMALQAFKHTIDVNLVGTFNMLRLCAERMMHNAVFDDEGGRGVIINTASIAAFQGPSGTVAYSASKAAIVGMALPLARDLAAFGIRVNTIAPGLIYTAMTLGTDPAKQQRAEERAAQSLAHVLYPRRFGAASEVAHLAQFLIENDYVNAECIRIDAGKRV